MLESLDPELSFQVSPLSFISVFSPWPSFAAVLVSFYTISLLVRSWLFVLYFFSAFR
ncbi:hypothetical protein BGW80DRAFT_1315180 [Lactifluus volemus]|nr:hypothetical protein BGW80DRAFT_1315180 [Lactifluus volemus]